MDTQFLQYYERELRHLREMGKEFSAAYPKIAGRLTLDQVDCPDPYVERLLEGFAFLAARVHLKLDAAFPRFTQGLLATVHPLYLAPTPSMAIVQCEVDRSDPGLAKGFSLPRGSSMRSIVVPGEPTACEYRTAHDLTLWPVNVVEARYVLRELESLNLGMGEGVQAALQIRLACNPGLQWNQVQLDRLSFFIAGTSEVQIRLYEQIIGQSTQVVIQPATRPVKWMESLGKSAIQRVGFDDQHALLPVCPRAFQGYRLLREYFTIPQRFFFFEVSNLRAITQRLAEPQLDLIICLKKADSTLERTVTAGNFKPHCTPVINLFPKRCDRIQLSERFSEFPIIPDRTRTRDFEVFDVTSVTGHGVRSDDTQPFYPFYRIWDSPGRRNGAFYTVNRQARLASEKDRIRGARSGYAGSEVFVSLVDGQSAPYRTELKQLGIEALCTNRDLPLFIPLGKSTTDFSLETGGPVKSIRCVNGAPTAPRESMAQGDAAWRLISHLSLNYLSLIDAPGGRGAAAIRSLLELYCDINDPASEKQSQGIKSISSEPIVRRIVSDGMMAFVRGLQISMTLDDQAYEGTGAFLMGAVLEQFFARYVSMNSFTETVVNTVDRGRIMEWTARPGRRQIL
jgi:type VI secretion system protein ImpG